MEKDTNRISNEYQSEKTKNSFSDTALNKSIPKFLKAIAKGIDNHGIGKITSILTNLDINAELESKGASELVDFICKESVNNYNKVCEDKISKNDLFEKDKRGEVTLARKMAIVLLSQFIRLTPTQLGEFFGRSRQVIHLAIGEFKALDQNLKQDLDFLNRHQEISQIIRNYMEKNQIDNISIVGI